RSDPRRPGDAAQSPERRSARRRLRFARPGLLMGETISEPLAAPAETLAEPERRGRFEWRAWLSTLAKGVVAVTLGMMIVFAALMAFLDTGPGHRFIVDRIAAMTPASGLRVRIGRIEGSIWGRTILRDVRLYDPDGLFAESS